MPPPVVCVVGNPINTLPPGFLLGKTEANTSAALPAGADSVEDSDARVSSYDDVNIAILVVLGGGFLVARSSSVAKPAATLVRTTADVARRKMLELVTVVMSSAIASCTVFSSLAAFPRRAICDELDVSFEKKLRREGMSDEPMPYDSVILEAAVDARGFQPMALIAAASICVLSRSTETICMRPSFVLVSRSRGMGKSTLGDDFFFKAKMHQSSIQNSMLCNATNVRLVARNWLTDSRFGTVVVVFL